MPPENRKAIALRVSSGSSMLNDDLSHEVVAVDIEDSIRMNADCMAVQTFIGADGQLASIDNLSRVINAGFRYSIPTLGVVAVGKDMERTDRFFKLATRIVAEMGVQLVKTYYCDNFEEIVAACPVPIVVAGGKKLPEDEALTLAYRSIQGGARGLDMGRNIFQSEHSVEMAQAIRKIVHEGYTDKEATDVYYWFGSDTLGRDIWTRVWEGTRVSLGIAVVAAVINMTIGMSYGLISGYFGGLTDSIMQRFAEINNGIPRLVIVTLLLLVLSPGFTTIVLALVITEWISMSRIARAEMLKLKEQEFVLASRTLGAGSMHIIFSEVLPNIIGQIITQLMFTIPTAIFTEAFLSFVGIGISAPASSWGTLANEARGLIESNPSRSSGRWGPSA